MADSLRKQIYHMPMKPFPPTTNIFFTVVFMVSGYASASWTGVELRGRHRVATRDFTKLPNMPGCGKGPSHTKNLHKNDRISLHLQKSDLFTFDMNESWRIVAYQGGKNRLREDVKPSSMLQAKRPRFGIQIDK